MKKILISLSLFFSLTGYCQIDTVSKPCDTVYIMGDVNGLKNTLDYWIDTDSTLTINGMVFLKAEDTSFISGKKKKNTIRKELKTDKSNGFWADSTYLVYDKGGPMHPLPASKGEGLTQNDGSTVYNMGNDSFIVILKNGKSVPLSEYVYPQESETEGTKISFTDNDKPIYNIGNIDSTLDKYITFDNVDSTFTISGFPSILSPYTFSIKSNKMKPEANNTNQWILVISALLFSLGALIMQIHFTNVNNKRWNDYYKQSK